ncbi:Uncharacterised protein [uncultured archaeon]|nr:Uncharacterised protein [uncultured archaeon]
MSEMSINLKTGAVDIIAMKKMSDEKLAGMAEALGIDPSKFETQEALLECIRVVTQTHAGVTDIQEKQRNIDAPEIVALEEIACEAEHLIDTGETDQQGRPIHRCRLRPNMTWVGDNGCVDCHQIYDKTTREQRDAIIKKHEGQETDKVEESPVGVAVDIFKASNKK